MNYNAEGEVKKAATVGIGRVIDFFFFSRTKWAIVKTSNASKKHLKCKTNGKGETFWANNYLKGKSCNSKTKIYLAMIEKYSRSRFVNNVIKRK